MESIERMERRARRAIGLGAAMMMTFSGLVALWSGLAHLGEGVTSEMPLVDMVTTWVFVVLSLLGFGVLSFGVIELVLVGRRERRAGA
jgi:TRAP-type C4-dicarboxylate transport system permease small subunit